jgi:HPt (histidine-containing phosphotransfer) domain-containing protein
LPDKSILDITRLEEAFDDDVQGIAELLEMALETGKRHRRALEDGLAANDAQAVARAAHGIKGSAGNIGANVVYQLATELDARARTGNLDGARESIAAIDAAYARVADEVRAYRASVTGSAPTAS